MKVLVLVAPGKVIPSSEEEVEELPVWKLLPILSLQATEQEREAYRAGIVLLLEILKLKYPQAEEVIFCLYPQYNLPTLQGIFEIKKKLPWRVSIVRSRKSQENNRFLWEYPLSARERIV